MHDRQASLTQYTAPRLMPADSQHECLDMQDAAGISFTYLRHEAHNHGLQPVDTRAESA
jgi:hypothetical protein